MRLQSLVRMVGIGSDFRNVGSLNMVEGRDGLVAKQFPAVHQRLTHLMMEHADTLTVYSHPGHLPQNVPGHVVFQHIHGLGMIVNGIAAKDHRLGMPLHCQLLQLHLPDAELQGLDPVPVRLHPYGIGHLGKAPGFCRERILAGQHIPEYGRSAVFGQLTRDGHTILVQQSPYPRKRLPAVPLQPDRQVPTRQFIMPLPSHHRNGHEEGEHQHDESCLGHLEHIQTMKRYGCRNRQTMMLL